MCRGAGGPIEVEMSAEAVTKLSRGDELVSESPFYIPMTGPAASANPDVPAHTPTARLLALASGYS